MTDLQDKRDDVEFIETQSEALNSPAVSHGELRFIRQVFQDEASTIEQQAKAMWLMIAIYREYRDSKEGQDIHEKYGVADMVEEDKCRKRWETVKGDRFK